MSDLMEQSLLCMNFSLRPKYDCFVALSNRPKNWENQGVFFQERNLILTLKLNLRDHSVTISVASKMLIYTIAQERHVHGRFNFFATKKNYLLSKSSSSVQI